MKKIHLFLLLGLLLAACDKDKDKDEQPIFVTDIVMPDPGIEFTPGDKVTIKAQGFQTDDDIMLDIRWLAFHMMGLYPNAGQDYYLINTPLLEETIFRLDNGRTFRISTQGLSDKNRYIQSVTLNGAAYPYSAIRHKDIIAGGELILKMGKKPSEWGQQLLLNEENKK